MRAERLLSTGAPSRNRVAPGSRRGEGFAFRISGRPANYRSCCPPVHSVFADTIATLAHLGEPDSMPRESFVVDASIVQELGERLIGKPAIALGELVKNAFDADATICRI